MRNRCCNNYIAAVIVGKINNADCRSRTNFGDSCRKAICIAVSQQQLMRTAVSRQQFCHG